MSRSLLGAGPFREPGAPLVHAAYRGGAREDASDAGVYGVEVAEELLEAEVQVREEVYLVYEHEVGRAVEEGKAAQIGWMGRGCTV